MKRCFVALALAGLLAASLHRIHSAQLRVTRAGKDVTLSWPTQATGFTLEATASLTPPAIWSAVTNPPLVFNGEWTVTQTLTNTNRFFRLRKAAGEKPVVFNLAATNRVALNGSAQITFDYADPECDVVALEITRSNLFERVTNVVPAGALGLTNLSGQAVLSIAGGSLPFGTNTFIVRLKDRTGGFSTPLVFTLAMGGAGAGGTAPSLQNFAAGPPFGLPMIRPPGENDRVFLPAGFSYHDAEADIERLRYRLTHPGGRVEWAEVAAASKGVTGGTGNVFTTLFAFRSTNAPGSYGIELTAIDRNGNFSASVSASVNLAASGNGLQGPRLTGFSPASGGAGTVVTLTGGGFNTVAPTNNRVTFANIPVEPTSLTSTSMQVVIPPGAGSGRFAVRHAGGAALSAASFIVPASVTVSPASADVIVNRREQFSAEVVSARSVLVNWRVNGIPGGNASVGTISADGLFIAPAQFPAGKIVTVSAALADNSAVSGQATVTILPPPLTPGVAEVFAATGGMVCSRDGRAMVEILPQALPVNTTVSVEVLRGTNAPAQPGLQTLGVVAFGPGGLFFNQPVTITIPLMRYLTPGTTLPLRLFNPTTGTFTDEGIGATVAANGEQATASVSHFSIYTIAFPPSPEPLVPPAVTSIFPTGAQEGLRCPVLIEGDFLTGDLVPEILLDGVPSADILPGTLHTLTNRAGVLLDIQTIPDLPVGIVRMYTLRLKRFGGTLFVDVPFSVIGLDEFVVPPGATNTVTSVATNRFSEIQIGDGAAVVVGTANPLIWEATRSVKIEGNILANGQAGVRGFFESGGGQGLGTQFGGAGGRGRDDNGCFEIGPLDFGFTSDDDCAEPENHGGDGNVALPNLRFPEGLGGKPGVNVNLLNLIEDFITDSRNCILSGGSEGCVQLAADVWQITPETLDIVENYPVGQRGWPGVPGGGSVSGFGNGGGGGGGGGRDSGFFASLPGNGGGAGGDGGRPIRIVSADAISFNGLLTTAGGNGGIGGTGFGGLGFNEFLGDFATRATGGGGGGGSGGRLSLASAVGLVRGPSGITSTEGGTNGLGGLQVRDESDFTIRTLVLRFTSEQRAARGEFQRSIPQGHGSAGPVFLPVNPTNGLPETDHKVTQRNLLRVRFNDRIGFTTAPSRLFITNLADGALTISTIAVPFNTNTNVFRFEKNVLLPNGVNTLSVQAMHPLLEKRIVVLATDRDGDGLSDLDETDLKTNPDLPDTDGDGLNDGTELVNETSPFDDDTDDDGLKDFAEVMGGTSPVIADTDGDGFEDGAEVLLESNPLDALSMPISIPANLLFANTTGPDGAFLTLIDPGTGAYGRLSQPNSGLGFGLAFDWVGDLHIARDDTLVIHDSFVFTNTIIGPFGSLIHCHSLAYDNTEQALRGVASGPAPDFPPTGQILGITLTNGVATLMGVVAIPVHAMTFRADGALFAALPIGGGADGLQIIDPVSGAGLGFAGPLGTGPIRGLAFDSDGTLHAARFVSDEETQLLTFDFATFSAIPGPTIPRGVRAMAAPPFRLSAPLASLTALNRAAGNNRSEFPVVSPDGTVMAFASRATDLVPQPDFNGANDVFVRNLTNDATALVSISLGGSAGNGPSRPVQISADNRFVLFTSTASDLVSAGLEGRQDVFRRDLLLGTTELVSRAAGVFASGNNHSALITPPSMSADGNFIVFESRATDLVSPSIAGNAMFLRDMAGGFTTRLGATALVPILIGPTVQGPLISADGSRVVFWSEATNLVSGLIDANGSDDLFAFDRLAGTVACLTVKPGAPLETGNSGTGKFSAASISADGSRVAFVNISSNLTTLIDANNGPDIFLRDLTTGTTALISVIPAGTAAGGPSPLLPGADFGVGNPVISADGNFIAFESYATDLVAGSLVDTNSGPDIFLRDLTAGVTTLVSVSVTPTLAGVPVAGNRPSFTPFISADGRRVLFFSHASNLVPTPHLNGAGGNLFVWDRTTGRTTQLSMNADRTGSAGADALIGSVSGTFNLSRTGLTAVFTSSATNLARLPDRNAAPDVFFRRMGP